MNKTQKNKKNEEPLQGFSKIKPNSRMNTIDDHAVELLYEQYDNDLILADSKTTPLEKAIREVLYLENTPDYLSEDRLMNWGLLIKQAQTFSRIIVYVSIARDLPKTLGLTQGEYFDTYFGWPDYEVSKILRTVKTILYLKWKITSVEEILSQPSLLLQIGEESNHAINSLSILMKDKSQEHALKVFNKCQELISKEDSVKKLTASLIADVNKSLLRELECNETILNGAKDEYHTIEYSPSDDTDSFCNTPPSDDIITVVTNLKTGYSHIKSIVGNIDKYTSNDLNEISEALAKLHQIAASGSN